MKYALLALLLLAPLSSFADRGELPPDWVDPRLEDPCWPSGSSTPGCPGYVDPFPEPSQPLQGIYYCNVRSRQGKLYGPGPESRSLANARSMALSLCNKRTGGGCRIAQCYEY